MNLFFKILFLSRLVFTCLAAVGGDDDRLNLSAILPFVPNWFEEQGNIGWGMNWDLREPKSDADKPRAVRNIFFIRHGIYFRKNRTVDEQKLTPLGREQAEFLGKRLAEVKNEYKFEKCVFSTMLRFFFLKFNFRFIRGRLKFAERFEIAFVYSNCMTKH
ncbi:unnamed protein product [Meloidogyne enterolobii]|uniref:Uncharacterized protein n=1 Tax=Meloidogyne enterolobii TaxID=390850 RepID=A0ACB1A8C1_MELEN